MDSPLIPIFVVEGACDVYIYNSVEDAALSIEPWWVKNNEGNIYDSMGRLLRMEIFGNKVILSLPENGPTRTQELETILRKYLKASGEPNGDDITCDLKCLVKLCLKHVQKSHRSDPSVIAKIINTILRWIK